MSTHNIPFSIYRRKINLNYPKSAVVGFFQGTQERIRNSRGRQAIRVRAIEDLLYVHFKHIKANHKIYVSKSFRPS